MIINFSTNVPQKRSNKINAIKNTDISFEKFKIFFDGYLTQCFYYNHFVQSKNKDFDLIYQYFNKICQIYDHEIMPFEIRQLDNELWLIGGYILKDNLLITVELQLESLNEIIIKENIDPAEYFFTNESY